MTHVFVPDLDALELDEVDAHHLARSLRLRPGEAVTASDGAGAWRLCRFAGSALEPDGPVQQEARPQPEVTVGFALAKGDRPEWIVQKLTEVGGDHIRPMITARTVVRWDEERATRNLARLTRVAREAAMQSRRVWLPVVAPPAPFGEVAQAAALVSPVALAQFGGRPPNLDYPCVLIGPEGGWSQEELESGLPPVALGTTVLRVETAAMVAGALLCGLRAGIVSSSDR